MWTREGASRRRPHARPPPQCSVRARTNARPDVVEQRARGQPAEDVGERAQRERPRDRAEQPEEERARHERPAPHPLIPRTRRAAAAAVPVRGICLRVARGRRRLRLRSATREQGAAQTAGAVGRELDGLQPLREPPAKGVGSGVDAQA